MITIPKFHREIKTTGRIFTSTYEITIYNTESFKPLEQNSFFKPFLKH